MQRWYPLTGFDSNAQETSEPSIFMVSWDTLDWPSASPEPPPPSGCSGDWDCGGTTPYSPPPPPSPGTCGMDWIAGADDLHLYHLDSSITHRLLACTWWECASRVEELEVFWDDWGTRVAWVEFDRAQFDTFYPLRSANSADPSAYSSLAGCSASGDARWVSGTEGAASRCGSGGCGAVGW